MRTVSFQDAASQEGYVPSCYLEKKSILQSVEDELSKNGVSIEEIEDVDPKIQEAQKKRK